MFLKLKLCKTILALLFIANISLLKAQELDYPAIFKNWDIVNEKMTIRWEDGLFTGNGLLGNMIYMEDSTTLRMDIGRTDVVEHRDTKGLSYLYTKARLPIGHFLLKPKGHILSTEGRLDLWNAETQGDIRTDKGDIHWTSLTLAEKNVIVFSYTVEGEEDMAGWTWIPETSVSPRYFFKKPATTYLPNPNGKFFIQKEVSYYWQPMTAGGGYATAWNKKKGKILISIGYKQSGDGAQKEAVDNIALVEKTNFKAALAEHRSWWHQYYQKSLFFIPDNRMESFYWIQLYKIASGTRSDKPALDLQGPWTKATPWPAYWFNLNMQLEYSPLFVANHFDIAASLIKMIDKNKNNLKQNVPPEYRYNAIALGRAGAGDMLTGSLKVFPELESKADNAELELGNLNWLLYYYWEYYTFTKDESLRRKLIYLLEQSTNYFLDIMSKGEDGKYHLPYSYSPEYPQGVTRDCNYALALLRWSSQTLLTLDSTNSLTNKWKDVLMNLVDYPTDSTGLRIGRDVGFTQSHRHYSHLLMIYPLQIMNWEQINNRDLISKSLATWHKQTNALQGYSFTGGASIYAMMHDGDRAYEYLQTLLDKYVKHNTMYLESGPVIETPLAAATSMQELLLQNRNGKMYIFPALPSSWKDVSFKDFRAPNGFSISGVVRNGQIKWISIKSRRKALASVVFPSSLKWSIRKKITELPTQLNSTEYNVELDAGEQVTFFNDPNDIHIPVAPVSSAQRNSWGIKK